MMIYICTNIVTVTNTIDLGKRHTLVTYLISVVYGTRKRTLQVTNMTSKIIEQTRMEK